jgi:two-component system OmpR family sensor kinase
MIKDDGIGISKDKQSDIFNRFNRATTISGGFGIGLDIVSEVAKRYNIKIDLISKLNEGSTFILKFLI